MLPDYVPLRVAQLAAKVVFCSRCSFRSQRLLGGILSAAYFLQRFQPTLFPILQLFPDFRHHTRLGAEDSRTGSNSDY